MVMEIGE